jgi:hypothetical protein
LTRWFFSKGPNLAFMMHRAYNAFLGDGSYVSIPDEERQKWLRAVRAVIETPQLTVTLHQGDTIPAYPQGVIEWVARQKAREASRTPNQATQPS